MAEMFANRLRKRARHLRKWARRESIDCYRLYDRDIPELPAAVDLYEGRLNLAFYARGGELPSPEVEQALASAAAGALDIPAEAVFIKGRQRQRGLDQYERVGRESRRFIVREGGLKFRVNLSDYLDTGLFLDHRNLRAEVRREAAGKRVLNLFGYTGSFSVYAAAGGALSTTTVDMSRTYLDWAYDNLALNGFVPATPPSGPAPAPAHRLVQADVLEWLDLTAPRGRWDIAIVDPPTFSNSKRMKRGSFDVQRDHADLLAEVYPAMRTGGVVYFSTNQRKFKPDDRAFGGYDAEEITGRTVPEDFARRRPHRAWRIVV